jgi:hypothetical protein
VELTQDLRISDAENSGFITRKLISLVWSVSPTRKCNSSALQT